MNKWNLSHFWRGSLIEYDKIKRLISWALRCVPIQKYRLPNKELINIGCGPYPLPNFVNVDYLWVPGINLCWDLSKPLPFKDSSYKGIFTEHCLEHLDQKVCQNLLDEFYRVLVPSGRVRIVVPDAELYINLYNKERAGETPMFPYIKREDINAVITPMMIINRVFRKYGHRFAYDFETLEFMLRKSGFGSIKKVSFGRGLAQELIVDRPEREIESLYVEASKP